MRTIGQTPVGMSRITRKRSNIKRAPKYYYTNNYDYQINY